MKTITRRSATIVGLLFLVSTLTFMIGSSQIQKILMDGTQNKSLLIPGVILEIICGFAVVGIGVFMFPILKLFNKRLALGYILFRAIECAIIIAGGIYLESVHNVTQIKLASGCIRDTKPDFLSGGIFALLWHPIFVHIPIEIVNSR